MKETIIAEPEVIISQNAPEFHLECDDKIYLIDFSITKKVTFALDGRKYIFSLVRVEE